MAPSILKGPSRVATLGCSLDVAPTVLGMIGRPYDSLFFGRDLLNSPGEGSRVILNHNRDIGIYRDQRLLVLGLNKNREFYQGDPEAVEMGRLPEPGSAETELEQDAIALYQVADDLYANRRYHIDAQ